MRSLRKAVSTAAPSSRSPPAPPAPPPPAPVVEDEWLLHDASLRVQKHARSKSAKRRAAKIRESLDTQRLVAMELLSSELEYLNQLTELHQSFELPLRGAKQVVSPATHASLFEHHDAVQTLHRTLVV